MRVKFNDHIDSCERVSYNEGSTLLFITTVYSSVYVVDCGDEAVAAALYDQILTKGYGDVSNFKYSN